MWCPSRFGESCGEQRCALFVGNDEKVFVINVERKWRGHRQFLRQTPKERPLTHDLINRIFRASGSPSSVSHHRFEKFHYLRG